MLAVDEALPENSRDHPLSGDWSGYRKCHLKSDLLVIYRKPDAHMLRLARIGSHSNLFGLKLGCCWGGAKTFREALA